MRMIKDEEEIEEIKKAVRISEEALKKVRSLFREGKEKDMALELDYQMRLLGGEETAFPTIVAGKKALSLMLALLLIPLKIMIGQLLIGEHGSMVTVLILLEL